MQQNLTHKFGPCGLLCEKCFAFTNGPIHWHANELRNALGDFDLYAKRFVTLLNEPVFDKYAEFKKVLNLLSSAQCQGCRKQECHLFSDCKVRLCYNEKGVEYCYECKDFPCDHTGFDDNLTQRWININQKIRNTGLESYYDEIKDKPRY